MTPSTQPAAAADEPVEADRDKQLIRSRLEQLMSGEVELLDADDVVADLKRRYAPEEQS